MPLVAEPRPTPSIVRLPRYRWFLPVAGEKALLHAFLLRALNSHAEVGVAVTFDKSTPFEQLVSNGFKSKFGGPQSMATLLCLTSIVRWADVNNYHGKIAYFMEVNDRSDR